MVPLDEKSLSFEAVQFVSFSLWVFCVCDLLKKLLPTPDSDNCPDVGIRPLLQFPHLLRAGPVLLTLLFSPQFLHPTKLWVRLNIIFHWSMTPVQSQLVFCMHFCVRRCIPYGSVERDVLHVHLFLCHLVLLYEFLKEFQKQGN